MDIFDSFKDDEILGNLVFSVKNVKRLSLRVKDGAGYVTIPPAVDSRKVHEFLLKNREWLGRHILRQRMDEQRREVITNDMLSKFRTNFPVAVSRVEGETGIRASRYQLRWMTSRWGSCTSATRRISINYALAAYPEAYLRYVLIHELCHIHHPDHSPAFWADVEKYYRNYKELRRFLRENLMPRMS